MNKRLRSQIVTACIAVLVIGTFAIVRHNESRFEAQGQNTPRPTEVKGSPYATDPPPISDYLDPSAKPSPEPSQSPRSIAVGKSIPVLMYHYVRVVDKAKDPLGYGLSITKEQLESELIQLNELGFIPTTMAAVSAGTAPSNGVVLTFDDGYEDFYTDAFPLLTHYGWKATLYIISGKIGGPYLTWDQIRELDKAGMEIGAHTVTHPDLSVLSDAVATLEIVNSKKTIELELGHAIETFAYPSGRFNQETVHLVYNAGFLSAVTTKPGFSDVKAQGYFELHRLRIHPDMDKAAFAKLLGR